MPYMPCETKGCRNYRKVPQAFCPKCQAKAETSKRKANAENAKSKTKEVKDND